MRFSPALLDEIRARLPVSQVVSRHVRLKRAGREFVGLSPFKQEKTPSFTVNDEKGFYHCFASGEHGDIFTFLIKVEGIGFPEAVEKLADEAGVELPRETPQEQRRIDQFQRLHEILEASCRFFEKSLKIPQGNHGARYLAERGLSEKDLSRFRLGYAPNGRDVLKKHLLGLGFGLEDIITSGMCVGGRDIAVPYDRFRDRVMFPINDLKGRVIAFGGRALSSRQKAKYLNSPETPLFHKGRLLYNIAAARQSAHNSQMIIAVEGYMDVIACARAGFDNCVAPLGTAMTLEQLKLMWRLAREPVLCFDGDEAGRKAAWRAMDMVLPELMPGFSLRFAFLPEGQDPDDLLREQGAAALARTIEKALPLVEVLWQRELQSTRTDTPERRADFEQRLRQETGRIVNPVVKSHYEKDIRRRLWELWKGARPGANATGEKNFRSARVGRSGWQRRGDRPSPLVERFQYQMAASREKWSKGALATGSTDIMTPREAMIVEAMVNHPWLLEDYSEEFAGLTLRNRELSHFRDVILQIQICFSDKKTLDREDLHVHLKEAGLGDTLERVGAVRVGVDRWVRATDQPRKTIEENWKQMLGLYRRQMELQEQLKAAERAYLEDDSEENLEIINDLNARYLDNENMYARSGEAVGREDNSEYFAALLAEHGLKPPE